MHLPFPGKPSASSRPLGRFAAGLTGHPKSRSPMRTGSLRSRSPFSSASQHEEVVEHRDGASDRGCANDAPGGLIPVAQAEGKRGDEERPDAAADVLPAERDDRGVDVETGGVVLAEDEVPGGPSDERGGGRDGVAAARSRLRPGAKDELFMNDVGKEGSTLRGVLAMFAMAASVALQYGAPPEVLARKLALMNFEPKGPTANPQIPPAQSLGDYIGRWLASQFCSGELQAELGIRSADAANPPPGAMSLLRGPRSAATGETCPDCGGTLQRTGACQTCTSCGYNSGCG